MFFCAQEPGCRGADEERECRESGGEAECGEAWAGEVEEARHGEGVIADVAVGEEVAYVGDEGDVAGCTEAVSEGDDDGYAEEGEGGVGCGDPAAGDGVFGVFGGVGVFGAGEGGSDEDQE